MITLKEMLFSISVLLLLGFQLSTILPVALSQSGPRTPNLQIHIYLHSDVENADLQVGVIDINDWPLAKEWIDVWAQMPSQITMRNYIESSVIEIDMNCQNWPTGSETSKFYDPNDVQCVKSAEFRKAVSHLIDRTRVISDVLRGYGYRADLPLSPWQSEYADMALYSSSGLIRDYNKSKAIEILTNAGFVDTDSNGVLSDPLTGSDMAQVLFYIRQDDPFRRSMGEMLFAEMESVGIPVKIPHSPWYPWKWFFYRDFNLYTGGWVLGSTPDNYYDLYSSCMYLGPSWASVNYVGFCNHEFDEWAARVKYPSTIEEARDAAKQCGRVFLEQCPVIPVWSYKAVKAYRTGWMGIVNDRGYGIDNRYTFLTMNKTGDSTIDWGFKTDIEQLNVMVSDWPWDHNVLDQIYDTLLGENPFTVTRTEYLIAESYSINSWNSTIDPEATVITFNIRDNIKWHGSNRSVTSEDVAFSFNFTFECSVGIAWNFPQVADMNRTNIVNSTAVEIYFNHKSIWALLSAGELPIINPDIWSLLTPGTQVKTFDPVTSDLNGNGIKDIMEDGAGPWVFINYGPSSYVLLKAYDQYYLTQTYVENRLRTLFHYSAGDVDENEVINVADLAIMSRALGTDSVNYPHGTDWGEYNPSCDLDQNGKVNALDMCKVAANYGEELG